MAISAEGLEVFKIVVPLIAVYMVYVELASMNSGETTKTT